MMVTSPPMAGHRRRRTAAGGLGLLGAILLLGVLGAAPASADLKVPLLPPVPLPTINVDDALDLSKTVAGVTNLLSNATGSWTGGVTAPVEQPKPKPSTAPSMTPGIGPDLRPTTVDSFSLRRNPAQRVPAATLEGTAPAARSGSYTSLVSDGLRAAAGRAAHLAGPLAAPLAVALFAVVLLIVAAKGPTRLAKVDEDGQSFRDRRIYRL